MEDPVVGLDMPLCMLMHAGFACGRCLRAQNHIEEQYSFFMNNDKNIYALHLLLRPSNHMPVWKPKDSP